MSDTRFQGKTIVITGAGGQLGREGCIYFSQRECRVIGLDLNPDALKETAALCEGNSKMTTLVCNVTDAKAVADVFASIDGSIDYLWNNAGYQGLITPILEQDPADFARVLNINVTGMFIVLQAAARRMKETGGGAIVNTASVAGLRGTPAMAGYASSKAAVMSLSVCAAKELAVYNIRVNSISPALIGPGTLWERQNELHAKVGSPYFASDPEAVASAKIASVPMKRLGSAEEVVKSVAYLFSDDASYTTGTNLVVDGGMSAGLKA